MQRAKAFLMVCAGIFLLGLTGFLGACAPGRFTVRNQYLGEISLWVDGKRTNLQSGERASLPARWDGSSVALYSCGWEASQTSQGQAPGCRFIPYTVFPQQSWAIVETSPSPRIVMRPQ